MSGQQAEVAILFCDVCDSTGLYARDGDGDALALVGALIDALAGAVTSRGGEVVRSRGDDLLCVFARADASLEAAAEMLALAARGNVAVHAGVHWGAVTHARGDIYGDAVNVAARMLALATPGELVASAALHERLSPGHAARLRLLGPQVLKGKTAPVTVFVLRAGDGAGGRVATRAMRTDLAGELPSARVRITRRALAIDVADGETIVIGRADTCHCVIDHPSVSRRHASLAVRGGIVTLTDSSSTGTCVAMGAEPSLLLRRSALVLVGRGSIALGARPEVPGAPVLAYAVEIAWPRR